MGNEKMVPLIPYIKAYSNREVCFNFRGRSYNFSLSHGLFSSAGIDGGSRFLLKVFSEYLDGFSNDSLKEDMELPFYMLDAGSGIGVLGICAARAIADLAAAAPGNRARNKPIVHCRAQDRDYLGKIFTEYNAVINGLSLEPRSAEKVYLEASSPIIFEAYAEPLLAGPFGQKWDLILSNIPAKAGIPVLEDFMDRSIRLLKKGGLVFLVVVNTLAGFFRSGISASASIHREETGKEHTVFVYGPESGEDFVPLPGKAPIVFNEKFSGNYPFYIRNSFEYGMEGINYCLDTVYGAGDFDSPGGTAEAAVSLATKIGLAQKMADLDAPGAGILVHDAGQGHFALWLTHYLKLFSHEHACTKEPFILSGRNAIALSACRAALEKARAAKNTEGTPPSAPGLHIVAAADIFLDRERLAAAGKHNNEDGEVFSLIAFFPVQVPESKRGEEDWEGLSCLTAKNGIVIAAMSSAEAERFDRKKPPLFIRMGDIKRKGFRALAYRKISPDAASHNGKADTAVKTLFLD